MADHHIEASKALSLARKYDDQGDLANAVKWAKKAIAIHPTPEAQALLSRLETKGVNGGSSTSTATPGAANGSAARPRTTAAVNGTASSSTGKEKAQERAYTPEQAAVVTRVKKAGGDFYKVLSIEKTVDDNGVKKAYRKLALQLHPDKNGAPGADEAFKVVSKAFTILSDPDKRAQYDRYGGDPDSRGGGGGGGPTMSSFAQRAAAGGGHQGMYTSEIDPQDLFNMFFGGGMNGGMNGFGGTTFSFGGPGMQRTYARRPRAGQQPRAGQPPAENPNIIWQLLPILLLGLFSLISYLPSMMGPQEPSYTFSPSGRFREARFTNRRGVAYYVDKKEWSSNEYINPKGSSSPPGVTTPKQGGPRSGLSSFENRIENSWKNVLYQQCSTFRDYQEQRIDRTKGFFGLGADRELEERIRKEASPACEELKNFGISIPIRA